MAILAAYPVGLAYSQLVKAVVEADPSLNPTTVSGYIAEAEQTFAGQVYRPSRGLFRLVAFRDAQPDEGTPGPSVALSPSATDQPALSVRPAAYDEPGAPAENPFIAPDGGRVAPAVAAAVERPDGSRPSPEAPGVNFARWLAEVDVATVAITLAMLAGFLLVAIATGYAVWTGP